MDELVRHSAGTRPKPCCVTIAFWIALVVVGVICLGDVSDSLPTDWVTQLRLRRHFLYQLTREEKQPAANRTEEFKLTFKTLYVLSKIRKSLENNRTHHLEIFNDNSTHAGKTSYNDEFSDPSQNTGEHEASSTVGRQSLQRVSEDPLEVRRELCKNSGADNDEMYCSELLPSANNVIFVETSCAANQSSWIPEGTAPPLSEKQSCAIYSAAYHNPSRKVILLFTCPVTAGHNWTKEWTVLFDLPNFFFGWVDMAELYANTSLSDLYHGPLARSKFHVSHQSDLFRQFVLYLYGGTYMDLDVITFKSLDSLGTNYLIHQGDEQITAGVWNLEPGHVFLRNCLFLAISRYDPNNWPTIGPALYTITFKAMCNVKGKLNPRQPLNLRSCGLRVLPLTTFFSVNYLKWEYFYRCSFWPLVEIMTRDSYGVHYWNHKGNLILHVGSQQPLVKFAEKHCPPVYYQAGLTLS